MLEACGTHQYLEGECHVMAVAIRRMFGGRFVLLCEDGGDYSDPATGDPVPTVHHVYVELPDGRVADVLGVKDGGNALEQWEAMNDDEPEAHFSVVRVDDEEGLSAFIDDGEALPLVAFTELDVDEAERFFLERNPGLGPGCDARHRH